MDLERYKRLALVLSKSREADLTHFDFFAMARARDFIEAYELGLNYFVYMGAVYEGTKGFCREKVGKVFSVDEMMSWNNDPFRPSINDYDPVLHLGGENCFDGESHCNHGMSFVSNVAAARMRPDLGIVMRSPVPTWDDLCKDLDEGEVSLVREFAVRVLEGKSGFAARAFDMAGRKAIERVLSKDGLQEEGVRVTLEQAIPRFLEVFTSQG